jgi:Arc/MetJ-type ribon-helix-helix transcriptional regulator
MAYKKISLNLSEEVYEKLLELAEQGAIPSVSEFIRRGIALQRYAIEAESRGEKLLIGDGNGTLREVVLLYG